MADLQQLEDQIVGLSLLDAAALVKKLEERLGVSAAAAAPVMVAGGGAAAAAPVEEKTEFTVVLKDAGDVARQRPVGTPTEVGDVDGDPPARLEGADTLGEHFP